MAKKNKTKTEIEVELRVLKRTRLAYNITTIIVNFMKYGTIVLCVYYITSAFATLAGKTTIANVVVNFLGNLKLSETVAWIFGIGGTIYGYAERRQRQKTIQRQHGRVKTLEQQIDPKRSSSHLTETGDTNPRDE